MRRTILGMAAVAALVFAVEARASDRGGAWASEGFRDESSQAAPAIAQPPDEQVPAEAEATAGDAGSASGEPSKAEPSATQEEFLRMIWTAA